MHILSRLHCAFAFGMLMIPGFAPLAAVAQASAPAPATARQAVTLQITNKDGLVTVREEDGAYRFAQIITTSGLRVQCDKPAERKTMEVSLRDGNGKLLYKATVGDGGYGQSGFSQQMRRGEYAGVDISFTPESAKPEEGEESAVTGEFVLGEKNYLVSGELSVNGRVAMRAKERDGKPVIMMQEDEGKWSEILYDASDERMAVIKDGKEIMSWDRNKGVLSSEGKEITVNTGTATITVDGKEVLTVGGKEKMLPGKDGKPTFITLDDEFGKMTMSIEEINNKMCYVFLFGKRRVLAEFGVLKPEFDKGEIRIVPSVP